MSGLEFISNEYISNLDPANAFLEAEAFMKDLETTDHHMSILDALPLPGEDNVSATAWRAIVIPEAEYLEKLDQVNADRKLAHEKSTEVYRITRNPLAFEPFQPLNELGWEHIEEDERIYYSFTALDALEGAALSTFDLGKDAAA